MLINKNNLSVVAFVSKNKSRKALGAVHVEKGRTVATDSFCLALVEPLSDLKEADYPKMSGIKPLKKLTSLNMPADIVERMMKALPSKTTLPILEGIAVITEEDEGQVGLAATNLDTTRHFVGHIVEDSYPDYSAILPKTEGEKSVSVNPAYLKKMAEWLAGINPTSCSIIFTGDSNKPLTLVAYTQDKTQKAIGLIMPLRT